MNEELQTIKDRVARVEFKQTHMEYQRDYFKGARTVGYFIGPPAEEAEELDQQEAENHVPDALEHLCDYIARLEERIATLEKGTSPLTGDINTVVGPYQDDGSYHALPKNR